MFTTGIVTGLSTTTTLGRGFYIQDPSPDANDATSEGIFVFTSTAPAVTVGDAVTRQRARGRVPPRRRPAATTSPRPRSSGPVIRRPVDRQSAAGAPTIVGVGGRVPPTTVIEDDATGDVETSGTFDPASDGIDFYESLEGMRVQVNNAVVGRPDQRLRRDLRAGRRRRRSRVRTHAAASSIRPTDFNPERIQSRRHARCQLHAERQRRRPLRRQPRRRRRLQLRQLRAQPDAQR